MDITGKKITVIGGKRSGMALMRLIHKLGGQARLSEMDEDETLPKEFREWTQREQIECEFNGHTEDFITQSDLVVLSPGVPLQAPCVRWAQNGRIPVIGEIEFAAQFCDKPVIAVTGSNGKTTVSTLISKVIDRAGYRSLLCGNVGFPFSEYVLNLGDVDYVVLEVSSFQMESVHEKQALPDDFPWELKCFRPHIAVILNFSQNHLDRHSDLDEYFSAKKRIYINQTSDDYLVLNHDDAESRRIAGETEAQVLYFNTAADGAFANPNHAAVTKACSVLGIKESLCQDVFEGFLGVEHRMEKVRNINGVDYINDSKATTAQAALWALEHIEQPVVMICGGRDKNIDFAVLAEAVQQKVKRMFVIGEAREKIRDAFAMIISLEECENLEEAVIKARKNAVQGDCVLLSPMCASFDMFADFEERGRVFKSIVNELK